MIADLSFSGKEVRGRIYLINWTLVGSPGGQDDYPRLKLSPTGSGH